MTYTNNKNLEITGINEMFFVYREATDHIDLLTFR